MTLQSINESPDTLTVRHFPLAAWFFVALSLYGMGTLVAMMLAGSGPAGGGGLLALALLGGYTLFIALMGGGMSTARFDRRAGTVQLRRYGLLGRRAEERRLSEVAGLQVRVLRRSQHRIELRLRSGEVLPLTAGYVVTFSNAGINRLSAYLGLAPELVSAHDGRPMRPR